MVIWNILILIILGIILAVSANAVVKATSYFAKRFNVKSFVIGFLLLGAATNTPEIFVAIQAVRDGVPQLSIGNLMGGSILLLSFFMGVSAIILGKIVLDHGMTRRDIAISSFTIFAPVIALWDGKLTRIEGIILVGMYLLHIIVIDREQHLVDRVEHHAKSVKHIVHAIFLCVVGIIGIGLASKYFVIIASSLATEFTISPFVLGLFLVTFGTNLPELSLVFTGIIEKKRDIAFGDILGSTVMHTPVLGMVCIVAPFSVPDHLRMRVTLILLALITTFFWWATSSKRDITRKEGIVLFLAYAFFVVFELMNI